MGEGFFPPMKAFQRRNTSCISKRNNAERRGNARPDSVQRLSIPALSPLTPPERRSVLYDPGILHCTHCKISVSQHAGKGAAQMAVKLTALEYAPLRKRPLPNWERPFFDLDLQVPSLGCRQGPPPVYGASSPCVLWGTGCPVQSSKYLFRTRTTSLMSMGFAT